MTAWWDAFPGRLEWELDALRRDGISATVDAAARERGVIRLELTLPVGRWLTQSLTVVFPDSYPFTRPEIFAPDLSLPKHQNPFNRSLCLIGQATENWRSSNAVAALLSSQLPLLAESLRGVIVHQGVQTEEAQGEPVTTYYTYEQDSAVFVDSGWDIPSDAVWGDLEIGLYSSEPFRGALQLVKSGRQVYTSSGPLGLRWSEIIRGIWIRLKAPVLLETADAIYNFALAARPDIRRTPLFSGVQVIGLVFPEEVAHRHTRDGWLFIVRRAQQNVKGFRAGYKFRNSVIRAARAGETDLAARLPLFSSLRHCGVAVFGTGCIGAPSVLEFARCGFRRVHLLDCDTVEAGTTVRWPFGLQAVGHLKVEQLARFIQFQYPFVDFKAHSHRLGAVQVPSDVSRKKAESDTDVMATLMDDVDIVYDATAESGLQHLLSATARERGLPYIEVSGTNGGWGGIVSRIRPNGACWLCYRAALGNEIALPPADPSAFVQPEGCSRPTYVGAGFDLSEIALQGVRLAVATVLADKDRDFNWDVAVLSLRDDGGRRIEPRWSVHKIQRVPNCPVCGG